VFNELQGKLPGQSADGKLFDQSGKTSASTARCTGSVMKTGPLFLNMLRTFALGEPRLRAGKIEHGFMQIGQGST
jgi:hypothetical protein